MQTLYFLPTSRNAGLTSVALGMVRALQRQGLRAGFAKPVPQQDDDCGAERSVHFARALCRVKCSDALDMDTVLSHMAAGKSDDLMERIVSLCLAAAEGADVLVVEGLHVDAALPVASDLNLAVARSLHAEVVLVAQPGGSSGSAIELAARQCASHGLNVAGVVFNKAPAALEASSVQRDLHGLPLWGVIGENPALMAPRTLDVVRHLDAEVLIEGDLQQRRMLEAVLTVRSVAGMVERLRPGALIVSSGDRDDVVLATALAAARGIELAGLLLTGASAIEERVFQLVRPALEKGTPVLRVGLDSYHTATRLSRISRAVAADDCGRMEQVLDAVAGAIDAGAMLKCVRLPACALMSPPAFRYQLIERARKAAKRIVLPEGDEPRTVNAAIQCHDKGIARCVLLARPDAVAQVAKAQGLTLPPSLEIIDPDAIREKYVAPMVDLRKSKGLTPEQAREQLSDSVVLGTMMLAVDDVDGLVSGAVHTTANTVRPALQLIKTDPATPLVSSVFFMLMPDQVFVYGDCAINTNPTAQELSIIALQSAASAKAFGIEPRVAMISYSTGNSGTGDDVDKVREATRLAREKAADLPIDGPLQYDAACVPSVGRQKAPDSPVAGRATVFIFPDLNTGNTTYKAVQRSAGVVSVGPMMQGLRKPVNDLSRGALVDDIIFTIALTAIQAGSSGGQPG
ncbi:MAG: phosphate acetyltransferase [Burkholderiaceae bacterium]|nr:phosphate acetyltransferase [Burkholderiaceae bacterium]